MITVLGAGNIGYAIATDLSKDHDVYVIDKSADALSRVKNCKTLSGTIHDHMDVIEKSDVVVSALPGSVSYNIIKFLIEHGKNVVDISYMNEDPFLLEDLVKQKNVTFIPDAGFAPGLSNIIAGYMYKFVEGIEKIQIYVGGVPKEPIPPLNYTITWNVEGLIDEYTRLARVIRGSNVVTEDPLKDIEPYYIPNFKHMEAFYSDGLRTMIKTIKVKELFEKTLRYPGHLDKIKMLRDLGFFSTDTIYNVTPREITVKLLEKLKLDVEDISILEVKGFGKNSKEVFILDSYDTALKMSSMSRMTGFTASILARIVLKGKIKGFVPPELIGFDQVLYMEVINELRKRKVKIDILSKE
ncbi:MAG: saccharopine dehydrogenase family protein [Thermoplasmata archaeon]